MITLERVVETLLWKSRLLIFVPVVASILLACGMLIVTTLDTLTAFGSVINYLSMDLTGRDGLRIELISAVVAIIDGFLLAAILLIFGLGLYELFINKIDAAENSEFAARLLLIRSFDDLKNRLAGVVLLILAVKFFQIALSLKYKEPLELLYLAIGTILISGALYLTGRYKVKDSDAK